MHNTYYMYIEEHDIYRHDFQRGNYQFPTQMSTLMLAVNLLNN